MPVYFDHNATSPVRAEVREAMARLHGETFGNPASVHSFGQAAGAAVDRARRDVRDLVGGPGGDLVFTGSGTEAVFTALAGAARAHVDRGRHLVVSGIEHRAALDAAALLEAAGWEVTRVMPDPVSGVIAPEAVAAALRADTALVSVLHANNETGVVQPSAAIASLCRDRGVLYHADAIQSAGKIEVAAETWGVDLVSVAAHKLGGPMGVGALWKRPGVRLAPVVPGSQERGLRGGTLNVGGIVGFGAAARAALRDRERTAARLLGLRNRLERDMARHVPGARLTAGESERLPNTAHFTFGEGASVDLVPAFDLEGFAVSAGSACQSGSEAPSHVLLAMGRSPREARTAVRVSLGPENTEDEIVRFVGAAARVLGSRAS
jgi:cysteine desulfurase